MSIIKRPIIMLLSWLKRETPNHNLKGDLLMELASKYKLDILVETGTYLGDMVAALISSFKHIYSVELDHELTVNARRRFVNQPHVTIMEGDSAKVLPNLLQQLSGNTLFWLDGHYSGGVTAKGETETPITLELKAILSSNIPNFVIAIDDANLFNGFTRDYPTIDEIKKICNQLRKCKLEVRNNIIIVTLT
jgi:hypothetical protein